jgi:hypothetical protein
VALVISKSRLWPKVGYVPNRAQRRIHEASARMLVTAAGRRLGKSTAGGMELLPEVYKAYLQKDRLEELGYRQEYWIVGPQYTDSEKEFRAFYNACRRLKMPFDKPGTYYDAHSGDMQASLWGGRFLVKGQSAKYPDHLVGEGLHGVILAEAAKMKELIWTKYLRPTLIDYRGWAKFNSTPEGRNWFHGLYMKGLDAGEPDWASLRFPSWMNEKLFPLGKDDPEVAALAGDLSDEMIAQEINADFQQFVGRVFKRWDEDWHVRAVGYNPEWPLFIATDYGWTNPNVALFIQVDHWDNVYVIDEYYQSHRSPEEFAADLADGSYSTSHPALCRAATKLFGDPEDPASSYVLAEKLRLQVMGNTGGLLKTRLELIRKWLKDNREDLEITDPGRHPKMIVAPKCKYLISEMDLYRYPKTKSEQTESPENPMKKDDHAPEALGRFFAGHFGPGAVQAAARSHQVKMTRGRRRVTR